MQRHTKKTKSPCISISQFLCDKYLPLLSAPLRRCEPPRRLSAFRAISMARTMFVARRTRPACHLPKRQKRINSSLNPFFRDIRLMLFPPASGLGFQPVPLFFPFPSSYEPIFFGFILLFLTVPRLRGASSSVRKDEGAPVQCILRIGCPRGGLRSGVVGSNAGESTDTWTKAQMTGK